MARRTFGRILRKHGTYTIRYRLHGVEVQKAIGPKRKDAADALADIASKIAREEHLGIRPIAEATLAEVWKAVRPARASRLSPRALEVADHHAAEAAAFFGERPVSGLRPEDVEAFLVKLSSRGRKPGTVNRYVNNLSGLWREAALRGFAKENVVRRVKRYAVAEEERPFIGEADLRRLVAAARPGFREVLAILGDTALRRGELLDLCWQDVDLGRAAVLVRRSKNGKGREVPLTARARDAFLALREGRGPIPMVGADPVLADLLAPREGTSPEGTRRNAEALLSKRYARLAKRIGLGGTRLHDLRHSAASRMVMAGVPLSAVARVTGHSTLRCAALYGKHAPQDAAKMAIRALEAASAAPLPEAPATIPEGAAGKVETA